MASVPSQDEDDRDEKVVFKIGSESYESDHGMERYSDEDDSSGCCDDEEANAVAASGRMKSMGVMMGDDYDESSGGESCCVRYWLCWICCSFLIITMIVGFMGAVEYQKEAAILYGIIDEDNGDVACTAYDDNALTAINNFYEGNNDTSKFCQEGFPDCQCKHPYRPTKPTDHGPQWTEIQTMNLAQVQMYSQHKQADVALLGDSIIEHFTGLDLGYSGGVWKANKRAFDRIFNRKNGGKVNGVALGVGGDRIANLLFRLQNGEAPAEFHPKIWWILIGTNDLEDKCNADTIVVGQFRLVDEIRKFHPGATIVFNSILPRNENPNDLFASPTWPIIQEINLKLECYANTAKGVEFFNATDVFTAHSKGKVVVNRHFMQDAVHPNAEGTRLWGDAIADKVIELKQKKKRHHKNNNNHHEKTGGANHTPKKNKDKSG